MMSYASASQDQIQAHLPQKTRRRHPWLIALGILLFFISGLAGLGSLNQPSAVQCNPPQCPAPPPQRQPLSASQQYTSTDFGFSLQYSTNNISPSNVSGGSIAWDGQLNNNEVTWSLNGVHSRGRDARQIVDDIQSANYGGATLAYTIPGADLGFTPGYGNVYDVTAAPGGGSAVHERLIIIAAVRSNIGVVMVGMGPFEPSTPANDHHPNPAETPLVNLGDYEENVTSVTWPGEPPL